MPPSSALRLRGRAAAVTAIMAQVEESARSLQSEVGFVFLPSSGDPSVRAAFVNNGYQSLKVDEMTSPAWREAAHEQLRDGITGLYKVLRPDRVTKPI